MNKSSDLAKMGSLSYRFNIGPLRKSDDTKKDSDNSIVDDMEVEEIDDNRKGKNKNNADIMRKMKQAEESKKLILNEYLRCEKELRQKN